jgi:hypothetical protein
LKQNYKGRITFIFAEQCESREDKKKKKEEEKG